MYPMSKCVLHGAFLVVSACLLILNYAPEPKPLAFPLPVTSPLGKFSPSLVIEQRLLAPTLSAHSATLVRLPDGRLSAFWFAGSREGASDVKVWQAQQQKEGTWTTPVPVISAQQASYQTYRFIRKLGNPVAFVDARGRLHLVFVSVSLGGWATSRLSQMTSNDGGQTWGPVKPLVLSPFFDISTLVRSPSLSLADAGILLPVYHELLYKFSELLRFDNNGRLIKKWRMNNEKHNLQPVLAPIGAQHAIALLRNAGRDRRLLFQETSDAAKHWSAVRHLNLPNPDSSVALARLPDQRLLLAYNPSNSDWSELALAVSSDGVHWQKIKTIVQRADREYSYPTLLVEGDNIHLVYTWERKEICYMRFNLAWLQEGEAQ